ncbi:MAG: hypothetical protein UV80_C0001G0111 [Candidatus Peregrinibacteria bacterium GW2011_GWF2_43_17]|nr:MAG: hypothetical protein UV80_C0001G0111 [Candidatus Peregrinibacteria bacterium GW2011_GWF2_43_17]KKT18952.1 MAG: hypothetical protein UW03_C0027G0011 [Candidatus Peregrinibacteria bacterium GW2011_GWA2_43_8]HAU40354.1 hypothetical protein [Candidatus Peregrinibacteria bacterium]
MKRIIPAILLLIATTSLMTGCTSSENNMPTEEDTPAEIIIPEPDTATVTPEVETYTVTGQYFEMTGEGVMYNKSLFFSIDKEMAPSILAGFNNVRFSNQEDAKAMFELNDEELFTAEDEAQIECRIEGTATIEFSNFEAGKPETDDVNDVKLEKVISKGEYTKTCE